MPFGFAFAGIALYELTKKFRDKKFIVSSVVLLLIFLLNIYQSQIGVFKEAGYTGTGLIIKSLQDAKENNPERKITLLLSDYNTHYNYQQVYTIQQAYGLENIRFETIRASQLQCSMLKQTDILLFDNDIEAKNVISHLVCPPHYNLSIKILSPKIYQ